MFVGDVAADGWPQKRGDKYLQISLRSFRSATYYEFNGNDVAIPTVSDYTFSFYGEVGLTDRITAIVNFPFVERITRNEQVGRETGRVYTPGAAVTGVSDPSVGARVGLLTSNNLSVSGALLLGLPLGQNSNPDGLFTGDGEFNQILKLEVGYSFYPVPAYFSAGAGVNMRSKGFSDDFIANAELGYSVTPDLLVNLKLSGVQPLRNGDEDAGGTAGFGASEARFVSFGLFGMYDIAETGVGVIIGAETARWRQKVLSGTSLTVGLYFR